MHTYAIRSDSGTATPIFQVETVYISPRALVDVLSRTENVTNVKRGKAIPGETSDVVARFEYLGRPFMVWEPFADSGRYWIGPADMVEGEPDVAPSDTTALRLEFERYRPHIVRAIVGNLV